MNKIKYVLFILYMYMANRGRQRTRRKRSYQLRENLWTSAGESVMSHDDVVGILLECLLSSTELLTDFIASTACLFHALSERQPSRRTERSAPADPRSVHRQRLEGNYEKRGAVIFVSVPVDVWQGEKEVHRFFRGCTCVTPVTLILMWTKNANCNSA